MTAKFQPGDKVLVEATVALVHRDGTADVYIDTYFDGLTGPLQRSVWDVPNDIIHFVEAGAQS